MTKKERQNNAAFDEMTSLQLAQFAIERTPDSVLWIGPDARILYANKGASQTLGYSRKELLTLTIPDIDPGPIAANWTDHWQELKQQHTMVIETEHKTKAGQLIPVEVRINFLEFDGKEYNIAFARDITERVQENERRFEQERRAAAEARRQAERLTVINEMSREVNLATTEAEVFNLAVRYTYQTFPQTARASIALLDESGDYFDVFALQDGQVANTPVDQHIPVEGRALTIPIREKRVVNTPDMRNSDWLDHQSVAKDGLVSALYAPLITGGRVIGTIQIASKEEANFSTDDEYLIQRVAAILASAIEIRQLLTQTQQAKVSAEEEANRLTVINEMSKEMNQATSESEIYNIVTHYMPQIIEADRAGIALLTETGDHFEVIAMQGPVGTVPKGVPLPLSGTDIEKVLTENRLLVQLDNVADSSLPNLPSRMNAPLMTGGKPIGTLNIASKRINAFTPRDEKLFLQIAALLATNIESQRLFAQTQTDKIEAETHVERLALLNEMGQKMSLANDEQEIFQVATEYTPQILSADRVSVALLTEEKNYLQVYALRGSEGAVPVGQHVAITDTSAGRAIQEKRVISSPDFQETSSPTEQQLSQQGLRSSLNAPMIVGERVMGTLNVASAKPYAFSKRDENLLLQIASFLGTTIENTRLYHKAHKAHMATEAANQELSETLESLKSTQNQLVEAEKMAALGGLVAGVAHEINTPVGVGVTAASALEDKTTAFSEIYKSGQMKRSDLEKYLDIAGQSSQMILRNLERAAELIQSFKQVAVDQSTEERREFLVKEYLEEILLSLRPRLKRTSHTVTVTGNDKLTLDSYPGAFSQIVTNLVMNSLVHAYEADEAGQLTLDVKQGKGHLIFKYTDDGKGITEENLNKIFDPFFTTKRGQGGSGLGLHIIYNLVTQQLGGTIRCESEVGQGTSFVIELPLS